VNEIQRLARAAGFSAAGLTDAFRKEPAFRLETLLLVVGIVPAWMLAQSVGHLIQLLGVLILLMVVELLNSAVEAAIDRIGPERHELSKNAKDYGSAAVLLTAVLAGAVWLHAGWLRLV
jgi:diacylglycerol kinase (ATP)